MEGASGYGIFPMFDGLSKSFAVLYEASLHLDTLKFIGHARDFTRIVSGLSPEESIPTCFKTLEVVKDWIDNTSCFAALADVTNRKLLFHNNRLTRSCALFFGFTALGGAGSFIEFLHKQKVLNIPEKGTGPRIFRVLSLETFYLSCFTAAFAVSTYATFLELEPAGTLRGRITWGGHALMAAYYGSLLYGAGQTNTTVLGLAATGLGIIDSVLTARSVS